MEIFRRMTQHTSAMTQYTSEMTRHTYEMTQHTNEMTRRTTSGFVHARQLGIDSILKEDHKFQQATKQCSSEMNPSMTEQ